MERERSTEGERQGEGKGGWRTVEKGEKLKSTREKERDAEGRR